MKKKGSMIFTFSSLLLFSLTGIAYAQQRSINCPKSNLAYGAVCTNEGGVIINNQNGGTINILQDTPSSSSSRGSIKNTQDPFVVDRSPIRKESLISDEKLPRSYPTFENLTIER
ncbi:hypothetical protein [Nostoc sp. DedSLP04]|uniref:hypothetical protein n=1 Tax=Nostoc sp. DedSLP04 TaxID=3075401 RepID=UPI002AD327BD|nr:hypothetical protein [Nostoc sp. DedSLP04]MDZ8031403.1 hypothetical protein [Nostoc sp. DedSLP04]